MARWIQPRFMRPPPAWLLALWVVSSAMTVAAQVDRGDLIGQVVDDQMRPLVAARVTIEGPGVLRSITTGRRGQFGFLRLPPGEYVVLAEAEGHESVIRPSVAVHLGSHTDLVLSLSPRPEQVVTLQTETPVLDVRAIESGALWIREELESFPIENLWTLSSSTAGVLLDREGLHGSRLRPGPLLIGKGAPGRANALFLDGVGIPAPASGGAAAVAFDLETLEEVRVTTGSADPRFGAVGASVNLVSRRAEHDARGSARYRIADGSWQSRGASPSERIDRINGWGAELGTPLLGDRVWLWGAWSDHQEAVVSSEGRSMDSRMESIDSRAMGRITERHQLTGFWSRHRVDATRRPAAGLPGDPESIVGELELVKLEDSFTASPNFVLALGVSDAANREITESRAGVETTSFRVSSGELRLEGMARFEAGSLDHELSFGLEFGETDLDSSRSGSESGPAIFASRIDSIEGHLVERLVFSRAMIQAGVRWVHSDFEEPGSGLTTISPRLAMVWMPNGSSRDVIQAAVNRYRGEPAIIATETATHAWNLSGRVDALRIDPELELPTLDEFLAIYQREILPEFVVGARYTHRRSRNFTRIEFEKTRGAGDVYDRSDFETTGIAEGVLPNGETYAELYDGLAGSIRSPWAVLTTREDLEGRLDSLEVFAVKRLSNRWMMQSSGFWNRSRQRQAGSIGGDSTRRLGPLGCEGARCDGEILIVPLGAPAGSNTRSIHSRWAYDVLAMLELPRDLRLGIAIHGREGDPLPLVHIVDAEDGFGPKPVLVGEVDGERHPDLFTLDLRLVRTFPIGGAGITLTADLFNVTNERAALARNGILAGAAQLDSDLRGAQALEVLERQAARTLRIGIRVRFASNI